MKKMLMILAAAAMVAACQPKTEVVPALDLADMDLTVSAGENFYQYANGGWMKNHPLSGEYSRYGTFDVLDENNVIRVNGMFKEIASAKHGYGSIEQKIADLYKQGLDSTRLNAEGAKPLKKYLNIIQNVSDKASLVKELAELNKIGEGGFFSIGVSDDMKDVDRQVLYISQGSLGMGDRDYYLDPANDSLKQGYLEMISKMLDLCGIAEPEKVAANAVKVEEELARISWSKAELRDVEKLYNPMSYNEFAAKYPGFDFSVFAQELGIGSPEKVIVEQLSFFEKFNKYFAGESIDVLKDYTTVSFVVSSATCLSDDFYDAYFDFFSRRMRGITEQRPRWKRAMAVPNEYLGEAVGQIYVKKYFPEENKNRVLEIVRNLQESLGQHIRNLDWMSDETKEYALDKLSSFTVKIGYPDKWKDYSTLQIDPSLSYFDNMQEVSRWYVQDNLSKLGKETDRSEWYMSPQTVNAYYNPTTNEICFPAAILQPPFFNADADEAVNYGAIGVVIGHEMTHGFDDQGRLFDKKGNMNNWWKEEDSEAFRKKTEVLVDQFNKIEVLPGIFANGTLSLGENIADQGGVGVAYTAMKNSWNGNRPDDIDGFTAEQRFFLGYAHVWAANITDEEKARRTKMDEHSLGINRVNATLRNFQAFFDAFDIKEGDKMWLPEEERIMIW